MTDSNVNIQNKIYYDVGIKYDPERKDTMYHFYSPAKTEINLSSALVDDPLNYDLAISKFKIDTECLPIMIPEMEIPLTENKQAMEANSAYKIWVYYLAPDGVDSSIDQKVDFISQPISDSTTIARHPISNRADSKNDMVYARKYLCEGPFNITMIPNCGCPTSIDTTNPMQTIGHNYNLNSKTGKMKKDGTQSTYAINTDPSYYIYDYQSFLDRINIAIEHAVSYVYINMNHTQASKQTTAFFDADMCIRPIIFKAENGYINMYVNTAFLGTNTMIRFSGNLYKYIGMGFKCKFHRSNIESDTKDDDKGSFYIDYNPIAFTGNHNAAMMAYIGYCPIIEPSDNTRPIGTRDFNPTVTIKQKATFAFQNEVYKTANGTYTRFTEINNRYGWDDTAASTGALYPLDQEVDYDTSLYYQKFSQQFSSLPNWNICKGILITSSYMPIKGEYYPTARNDGFLTHYATKEYKDAQADLNSSDGEKSEQKAIFNKQSMKVIDVYYPMSATAGDIRSCIIYDNTNIENGNKIDMQGGVDLDNFDLKVQWVDLYGNVYPLYLAPGCNVNIRFCLTRKKLRREDLVEGYSKVITLLGKIADATIETPQEALEHTFDVTLEPKRKRNKVDLPDVLENGLILKS